MSSLGKSSRKLFAEKDDHEKLGDTEHESEEYHPEEQKVEESQETSRGEKSEPSTDHPVSPRRSSMPIGTTGLSVSSHIITPFRRRSCMGNVPLSSPGRIRRRPSAVPSLSPQKSQPRTRPTLTRSQSNHDILSVSRRNLMRRASLDCDGDHANDASENVSDPTSTAAAMSSTPLPRTKRLSRRDLMRRSLSSSSLLP